MGVILSLVYLPIKYFSNRREKKKADQIALNYQNAPQTNALRQNHPPLANTALPQSRSQSGQPQHDSVLRPPELQPGEQVEQPSPRFGSFPAVASRNISTGTCREEDKDSKKEVEMASDEDYMAFLDKANEDPSKGLNASSAVVGKGAKGGKIELKAVDSSAEIPRELRAATEVEEWIYSSDADEPFVAVSLRLKGSKLPDEEAFAELTNHPDAENAQIEILDPVQWDSEGRYKEVVDATRKACKGGDVRVYRVSLGGTRVEYWVVGVENGKEARLVGVKALAVES